MLSNQILHKTAQDIREITGFDCAIWDMQGFCLVRTNETLTGYEIQIQDFRDDEEEPEDDELEIQDAQEYIPDPAQEADAQLDQVKKQLAASLAEDPEQAEKHEKEAPKAETKPEDDDFEVFDLDDEL